MRYRIERIGSIGSELIAPGSQIGSWGRGFGHAVEDFGQVLRVVVKAREIVWQIRIAVPAMLGFVSVFHFGVGVRICGHF